MSSNRTARLMLAGALASVGLAQSVTRLTLKQAEDLALRAHPSIASAQFQAEASRQVVAEARSSYYPTFGGALTGVESARDSRVSAGALNNPIILDRLASGFSVNQLIYDFGRTRNIAETARLRADAQDQTAEAARARVVFGVDRAYFALLRAGAVLRIAEETVKARGLVSEQITALARSKLKSDLDVSFAQVNLSEAKLLLSTALNGRKAAAADLTHALGERTPTEYTLEDQPLPAGLAEDLASLIAEAVSKRPELRALRLEESSAQSFARAERALLFPSVSSIATAGYAPVRQDALNARYAAAGVNISIPIFNGRLFSARRNEAELHARARSEDAREFENRLVRNVQLAYLNVQTARERLDLTEQLLQQARLGLELAQSRYELGLGSIVELSQAQLNATSAEIAGTTARYDYQTQRAALQYEAGAIR